MGIFLSSFWECLLAIVEGALLIFHMFETSAYGTWHPLQAQPSFLDTIASSGLTGRSSPEVPHFPSLPHPSLVKWPCESFSDPRVWKQNCLLWWYAALGRLGVHHQCQECGWNVLDNHPHQRICLRCPHYSTLSLLLRIINSLYIKRYKC